MKRIKYFLILYLLLLNNSAFSKDIICEIYYPKNENIINSLFIKNNNTYYLQVNSNNKTKTYARIINELNFKDFDQILFLPIMNNKIKNKIEYKCIKDLSKA